jgi:hypothetical protein
MVPIHPVVLEKKSTWLPGAIKTSDWLIFLMIFLSDTT